MEGDSIGGGVGVRLGNQGQRGRQAHPAHTGAWLGSELPSLDPGMHRAGREPHRLGRLSHGHQVIRS